jgi:gamma-glutamyltranspeptidase/glutathione hydrolase
MNSAHEGECGVSETVTGENGMVTAPHRAAAEAGAAVLAEGGNAVEAMIAMAATIAVVYPHMTGIGGDAFAVIAAPGRPPLAVEACGAAGALATRMHYEKKGYHALPTRGVDAAITVPGAVSAWQTMAEAAASLGGRMPRGDLLGDAIRRAGEGSAVTRSHARMLGEHREALAAVPGFAATFMADGKPQEAGAILRQERLADTLDRIAQAGFADFYRGDIAVALGADLEEAQAVVTRDDLRRHEARLREPLKLATADGTLYNTPPPTQGLASLIILGLFDRLKVKRGESFEHLHGLIEAAKRANAVRDRHVTDPRHGEDVTRFLDAVRLDEEARAIDMKRAGTMTPAEPKGDTVWMGAIDRKGIAVSFIQSLYWEFGSGFVSRRTGVLFQNRGASFSLDRDAVNPLMPGRKPFHTLNPAFARFNDGRAMVYGSMGGDAQPQFQSAVFTRIARFGMQPGDALAAPRWRVGRTWGSDMAGVVVEDGLDTDVLTALTRAGHELTVLPERYSDSMGHAGAVVREARGRIFGAADPRSDGAAVGG